MRVVPGRAQRRSSADVSGARAPACRASRGEPVPAIRRRAPPRAAGTGSAALPSERGRVMAAAASGGTASPRRTASGRPPLTPSPDAASGPARF